MEPSLPSRNRVISEHAQCCAALESEQLVSDPFLVNQAPSPSSNLLTMDGIEHANLRRLINQFLVGRGGASLRASLRARVSDYLPSADQPYEVVAQLAKPLLADFLSHLFGYEEAERGLLDPHLDGLEGILETRDEPEGVFRSNNAILRVWSSLSRCLRIALPGSVFEFMGNEVSKGTWTRRQAIETCLVLIHGAYENPLNHLGCIAASAAQDFGQFVNDFDRIGPRKVAASIAVQYSPVSKLLRYDRELDGEQVWIDLAAANLGAADRPLLSFGHGHHRCPGQGVAYDLGVVFIEALQTFPEDRWRTAQVEWRKSEVVNGPVAVRLS